MRHPVLVALCLGGTVALAGCEKGMSDAQVERAIKDVNVIDETNLNDVMLTVADPAEAVSYFQGALQKEPDRVDLKRGLAKSLVRAQKPTEAAKIWTMVAASSSMDRLVASRNGMPSSRISISARSISYWQLSSCA